MQLQRVCDASHYEKQPRILEHSNCNAFSLVFFSIFFRVCCLVSPWMCLCEWYCTVDAHDSLVESCRGAHRISVCISGDLLFMHFVMKIGILTFTTATTKRIIYSSERKKERRREGETERRRDGDEREREKGNLFFVSVYDARTSHARGGKQEYQKRKIKTRENKKMLPRKTKDLLFIACFMHFKNSETVRRVTCLLSISLSLTQTHFYSLGICTMYTHIECR